MKIISILLCIFLLTGATSRRKPFMPQPKGCVYVPGGDFKIDGKVHKIHSFWMAENEVTNKQYKEYLKETGKEPSASQYQVLKNGLWIQKHCDYLLNPIFDDFPVVGLSRPEMIEYAKWLSLKVSKENGIWPYEFRLPTVFEWQYAAYGGRNVSPDNYPWGQMYDRNSKGCYMLHCYIPDQYNAIRGNKTETKGYYTMQDLSDSLIKSLHRDVLTATKNLTRTKRKHIGSILPIIGMPVFADAYFPNDYSLYGMSGNVAEMTYEGEVMGGSFRTSSAFCKITNADAYPFDASQPQCDLGFRLVCSYVSTQVVKKQ